MKALGSPTTIFEVLVLASFAIGQTASPAAAVPDPGAGAEEKLTGLVSDAICKGMHFRKAQTPLSCTLKCVHDGADYSLVVGDKVYVLDGHQAELDKFAGSRATVRGRVNGDKVVVDSVTAVKKKTKVGKADS
jgi:hypothetical protein